ncbi:MAG TPA: MBOAT family protein [Planctomycetota bacterium]|nr:MBOAT family protein [Planctomycetota bacterium]
MSFLSTDYGVFLLVVFVLFWSLARLRPARMVVLMLASWFFYAVWTHDGVLVGWKYLGLILASTLLDYWIGGLIGRLDAGDQVQQRRRKRLLLLSLVGNLGVLGLFKYYNFFRSEVEALVGTELPVFDLLLPVGISFYTFQTLSYTIDIYRGHLKPARNLYEFGLFVAFFPQLVAGPIVRAADFLPQLERAPSLSSEDLKRGIYRILEGLFKKVVIADVLAAGIADSVFADGSTRHGFATLLGIYAYALQIYGDFAGYSDIAIGSARLLGFEINENFEAPYKARSIQDFWRRWHISLSTWLRDYLYVPLGGNRKGPVRTYINLALVMLLGGLWHGASWNFVIWGALHGLWLGVNRWWDRRGLGRMGGRVGHVLSIVLTFHMVCLAWVFFRSKTFDGAVQVLARLFSASASAGADGATADGGAPWFDVPLLPLSVWVAFALGFGLHFLPRSFKAFVAERFVALPAFVVGVVLALLLGLFAYAKVEAQPFIYFQF